MTAFRIFLLLIFTTISAYTAVVAGNHGLGLFYVFFGDIAVMDWPGQFNLDFLGLLLLSATWVAWRHQFSAEGIALGVVAFFTGAPFLSLYLFIASLQVAGDVKALLLGKARAAA